MRLIDLSHVIRSGMPVYPGDPTVPQIVRESSHGPDTHQSSSLRTGCHVGTHIDLPLHFKAGEADLSAFPAERCQGRGVVVDAAPGAVDADVFAGLDLADVDFVLVRTGWESRWGTPAYYADWSHLTPDAARLLAAAGLKGVGLDSPSVDPFHATDAHDILAAAGLINVENLANLGALPADGFRFLALPLRLDGAEASPVRAVALLDGEA
ncbi:MAG TPA: cyclase family protein [Candidatus Krumholzibacteria bacterium]|nr:cyclase family protein [Candidatus Krumholzibacteria bacterium]HRX49771.1 cyclase family protein [Candidatus Krumholzibacteria bacterium]